MAKDNQCLLQEIEMRKETDKTLPYGATNQSYPDPPSFILPNLVPGPWTQHAMIKSQEITQLFGKL